MNIKDLNFLKSLDESKNKSYFARISILDMDENPIKSIEGRTLQGSSISIANSNVRRTCTINLIADKNENNLTDVENLLSINKKIKIFIGIENSIDYLNDVIYIDDGILPEIGNIGKLYIKRTDLSCWHWTGAQYTSIKTIFDYSKNLIWFPMGVFVIVQPSLTHDASSCNISLTCKDKMALLNGELGGNLPASVTFHEYDQVIGNIDVFYNQPGAPKTIGELVPDPNEYNIYTYKYAYNNVSWEKKYKWSKQYGWEENSSLEPGGIVSIKNLIYDIIQTVVANYGNESLSKIIINDVPKEIKQIVRYVGATPLYYNTATSRYTLDESYISSDPSIQATWKTFGYNDDIGYIYTDFVLPDKKTLITNIGDNVCTVLNKIIEILGNYEYFYDIDGNFIFQEQRNFLNNSYNPTKDAYHARSFYIDNNKDGVNGGPSTQISENNLKLIGKENYQIDLYSDQKSVYTFNKGNGLVTAYNNNPNYTNLKNDYHIWGKNANNNNVIHYHIAIKTIPKKPYATRDIVFIRDNNGKFNGKIRMLNKDDYTGQSALSSKGTVTFVDKIVDNEHVFTYNAETHSLCINKVLEPQYTKGIMVSNIGGIAATDEYKKQLGVTIGLDLFRYTPSDWRAELYLQGLEAIKEGKRPDIYQQELLDLFDSIYEWGYYDDNNVWQPNGRFKTETIYRPNNLNYWIDFFEPIDKFYGMSVDEIEPKIFSDQEDNIIKIYSDEVPNCIIIDESMDDDYQAELRRRCDEAGQPRSVVDGTLYQLLASETLGYSAQEVARSLLYQYTTYNETITIQCVPIYYLDVNTRITVEDKQSGIFGDYIINSITMPLGLTSTMSISASRALNRI